MAEPEHLETMAAPQELQSPMPRRGLTGSTLKLIALVTMLIDHTGAALIERGMMGYAGEGVLAMDPFWFRVDIICRFGFGRIAFPIFCFLLVEGFFNTRDRKKYVLRLGLFCLLSEIPFDLALFGELFYWRAQNVFFTLCIGVCTIWAMDALLHQAWKPMASRAAALGALVAGGLLANALRTDYAAFGVVFIALFYLFRSRREWQRNVVCGLACAWELTAPLALIPIHFYNGARGLKLKYVFYFFYPVHLLLLAVIARLAFGV